MKNKTSLEKDVTLVTFSWLKHCATRQKVAGSIPDGFTGFFSLT